MPRDSPEKRAAQETKVYGDAVIVACGGLSYPSTGSTGDGYRFTQRGWHTVTEAVAGPGAVLVKEPVVNEGTAGLSLRISRRR